MPAPSWTEKGLDREFLVSKGPRFKELHKACAKGQRNLEKTLWLEELVLEYDKRYPERIDKMDLPKVGRGGTPEQRREAMAKVSPLFTFYMHSYPLFSG
jgi:hypothetical protein